jgi:hypothetical protein
MKVHIFVSVCFHTICTYVLRHAAEDANDEDVQFLVQEMEPVLRGQLGHVFLFGWKSKQSTVLQRLRELRIKADLSWASGVLPVVLSSLPGKLVASLEVDFDGLPTERTLDSNGISLDFADHCLKQPEVWAAEAIRREVLRATATNFEGFLAPVSIVTKLILQKDFRARYTWDSSFKPELAKEWQDWVGFLMNFKTSIRIPVKLFPFLSKKYQATSKLLRWRNKMNWKFS